MFSEMMPLSNKLARKSSLYAWLISSLFSSLAFFLFYFQPHLVNPFSFFGILAFSGGVFYFSAAKFFSPLKEIQQSIASIKDGMNSPIKLAPNSEWNELGHEVTSLMDRFEDDIKQIRQLGHTRDQFLENVSHELKTPIFTLKGFVETLLDGAVDDPTVNREFLLKIQSQANRLENLFNDLIQISRIESGELKMEFKWFDYHSVLTDLTDSFGSIAEYRGLKLTTPEKVNFDVYGDAFRLQTVLSNLISNAINYSDHGSIIISVKRMNDRLITKITDTGIGIPKNKHNRIFERFYRVDTDRSRKSGGSGLGLAIVKHILEAHNSDLQIESEPGSGTTISFDLKCKRQ